MKDKEQTKERVMVVKISPELHKILEERAAKWGVTNAQYVRNAILFEAMMAGNVKAVKMISGDLANMAFRMIKKVRDKSESND